MTTTITVPTGYGPREVQLYSSFADLFTGYALCRMITRGSEGTYTSRPNGYKYVSINTDRHPDQSFRDTAVKSYQRIGRESWFTYACPTQQVCDTAYPRMMNGLGSFELRYAPQDPPVWVLYARDHAGIACPAVAAVPGDCPLPEFPQYHPDKL